MRTALIFIFPLIVMADLCDTCLNTVSLINEVLLGPQTYNAILRPLLYSACYLIYHP